MPFIPLIAEFLYAVKTILKLKNINAPVVVVRGDGTLMSEEYTRKFPVETLLSGPAASVMGAVKLSEKKDCIVADMGGTTTDLAVVEGGRIKFAHKGVSIGKWQTGTKSIMVKPVGLGGDSLITFNKYGELTLSPVRAAPLSWLSFRWPNALKEMKLILAENRIHTYSLCEFFYLVKDITGSPYYNEGEKDICEALKNGPLSIMKLCDKTDTSIYDLQTKRLGVWCHYEERLDADGHNAHKGRLHRMEHRGSQDGSTGYGKTAGYEPEPLVLAVNTKVREKLYINIVKLMMEQEDESFEE